MASKGSFVWMSRWVPATGAGSQFYADQNGTITNIYAWAADVAPTTQATFDVLKNGVSIYTSNPKPTVAALAQLGADTTPNTTSFVKGDSFKVVVNSVGSIVDGRLGVVITFTNP
jgi:hypothetical protein